MFPTGNGPGLRPTMHSQPALQPMLNQPQVQPQLLKPDNVQCSISTATLKPDNFTLHTTIENQPADPPSNATYLHGLPTYKTKSIINTTQTDPTQHRLRVEQRRQFRPK